MNARAPNKRFKTMEPFIMRPPLKFQDDRRFEHGGQEMIFVLSGAIELDSAAIITSLMAATAPLSIRIFRIGLSFIERESCSPSSCYSIAFRRAVRPPGLCRLLSYFLRDTMCRFTDLLYPSPRAQ